MTQAAQLAQYGSNNVGLSFKNRIINGDMTIDQRNAGASVAATTSFPYTLDRWQAIASQNSKYTVQQDAGAVTFAGQSAGQSAPVLATTGSVPALVQLSSATHAAAGAGQ